MGSTGGAPCPRDLFVGTFLRGASGGCTSRTEAPGNHRPRIVNLGMHAAAIALAMACTGVITGAGDEGAQTGGSAAAGGGTASRGSASGSAGRSMGPPGNTAAIPGGAAASGEPCTAGASLASARIWRLTDEQYVNAVKQVLGIVINGEVSSARLDGVSLNLADVSVVNGSIAANYQISARAAAQQAAATLPMLMPCASATPDAGCVEQFVRSKVARLYRRPLTNGEVADLMAVYQLGLPDGPAVGVRLVMEVVLQSPYFIWRTEVGGGSVPPTGGKVSLTPFELASAVSFFFLDSVPDDGLWAKATAGSLAQPAVLAAEVDRLLALPDVKARLAKKAGLWLGLGRLRLAQKDVALFPKFTDSVKDALVQSEELFLGQVLFGGGIADLFGSRRLYLNQELATLYGIAGVTGAALTAIDVAMPERSAGIFSHPALIAAASAPGRNDVVHRGLFVYDALVCGSKVPPPPANVAAAIQMQPKNASDRELAGLRAQNPVCGGCHARFDPLGLVSERYDAIGRYQEKDAKGQPIDQSSVITGLGAGLDGPIVGVAELAMRLASQRRVSDCAVANLATMALGRDAKTDDTCALQAVKDVFATSGSFASMFKTLVTSPGFLTRDVN